MILIRSGKRRAVHQVLFRREHDRGHREAEVSAMGAVTLQAPSCKASVFPNISKTHTRDMKEQEEGQQADRLLLSV